MRTHTTASRCHRGGWCSEVKEEDRAQAGPGDMSGVIYPGGIGHHKHITVIKHIGHHKLVLAMQKK